MDEILVKARLSDQLCDLVLDVLLDLVLRLATVARWSTYWFVAVSFLLLLQLLIGNVLLREH